MINMINVQLKELYANDKDMLGYIDYLLKRFRKVDVYDDFHQLIHLLSDIEDFGERFEMQRALSYIYFYFPEGASVTILPPIEENGFDYIYEFTCSNEVICLDPNKRVKIPLQKFKELDDAELDDFFQFDLELL